MGLDNPHPGVSQTTPPVSGPVGDTGTIETFQQDVFPGLFGDYELLERLDQGGMGVVFRAKQRSLPRVVALKMIRPDRLITPQARDRFRYEAESIATLEHPHIIPIYEVGEHHGHSYFTMRLIEGGSLARRMKEFILSPSVDPSADNIPTSSQTRRRRLTSLMARVARAVHHAHQRGILHRDLKPGNVLLDAGDSPIVTDFGLAKHIGLVSTPTQTPTEQPISLASAMTLTGCAMGTPLYMAPEQVTGRVDLTVAVDIWSLGAMLYELLTGVVPFNGTTQEEVFRQIVEIEPERPNLLNPLVDAELEATCLRCLAKEPRERFMTAAELADALDPPIGKALVAADLPQPEDLAYALFRESGDALILVDPATDQIQDINLMVERLTHFTRGELLSMTASDLLRADRRHGVEGKERLQRASNQTTLFHGQDGYFLRTKQTETWIPVNITVSRLHFRRQTLTLMTVRDTREQKAAQRSQKIEAELKRVLSTISECLWSADVTPEGKWAYRYLSPVVEKMTGRPPQHFISDLSHWQEIVHPEDRTAWHKFRLLFRSGQSAQLEYRILRPDGKLSWLREQVTATNRPERSVLQLDGILADITESKTAQERITQLEQELDEARQIIAGNPPWWMKS